MRYLKDKLYSLIPAIYRLQDAKLGEPLEALISIIAEEVSIIEDDMEDLYDNWFIETCDEWVVPYIGDLIAAQILLRQKNSANPEYSNESISNESPRAWVANTLSYRRRKGTVAVLEQIAKDISGWGAKAVEFLKLIGVSQNINHILPKNQLVDIRNVSDLELLGTPFENTTRTIDIRNIKSTSGFHNVHNVGIFLWRIQPYPVVNSPAFDHGNGKYSFNQLGFDAPLFNHPVTASDISHLAEEINLPIIITRFALKQNLDLYYGIERSMFIEVDGSALPSNDIHVDTLDEWKRPPPGKVAVIDPILGRIAFQLGKTPARVKVSYYYGFSADIGGGFYDRRSKNYSNILPSNIRIFKISKTLVAQDIMNSLSDAINQWSNDGKPSAILEILDSEFYEQDSVNLSLPSNCILVIRSAEGQRPVLRRAQFKVPPNSSRQQQQQQHPQNIIEISGEKGSSLIFDGLWIDADSTVTVKPGQLGVLQFTHCTMVPDNSNNKKSIEVHNDLSDPLNILIHRSICGKIHASLDGSVNLEIIDSIVDGKSTTKNEKREDQSGSLIHNPNAVDKNRFCEPDKKTQGNYDESESDTIICFKTSIQNSTVFGKVNVVSVNASNTIFMEKIFVKRRQQGCMRFSYIPEDSVTPRRYQCQPEDDALTENNTYNPARIVDPKFTSEIYGDPAYAQLHKNVNIKIFEGADNESEMGAFNNLYQPLRIKNVKSALNEYLRYGMDAGIILIDLGRQNNEGRYY